LTSFPLYNSALPESFPRRMPAALLLAVAMLLPFGPSLAAQAAEPLVPPVAEKRPKVLDKFGDKRVDDYFWLREKDNPEVIAYLEAENKYSQAVMKPLEGFRESLYKEMLARIKETDESVPYVRHGYWYYTRQVEGLQYPIYCRRKGSMEAPEEILLGGQPAMRFRAPVAHDGITNQDQCSAAI